MALTPFRWISLAVIGCMLSVLGLVSIVDSSMQPRRSRMSFASDTMEARLRDRAGALNQDAQNLAGRYRLLFLMDSVARATSRLPDTGAFRVILSDVYTPDLRALIEKRIAEARNQRSGAATRIEVIVVSDGASHIRGVPRYLTGTEVRYQLPERPGDKCRVFIRTSGSSAREAFDAEKAPQHILGPCGYYAAFGEPGPAIRGWFVNGGWQYAIEGSWTKAPVIAEIREDSSIFKGPDPAVRLLSTGSGATDCMKGDLQACERMVAIKINPRWMGPRIGSGTYALSLGRNRFFRGAVGYQAGEMLADAVRELGRERFRTFWTSRDSVPVAYEKASGERWGVFIQRWMVAHYGTLHSGSRMTAYSLVASTILVILALGATMMISVRRTYT